MIDVTIGRVHLNWIVINVRFTKKAIIKAKTSFLMLSISMRAFFSFRMHKQNLCIYEYLFNLESQIMFTMPQESSCALWKALDAQSTNSQVRFFRKKMFERYGSKTKPVSPPYYSGIEAKKNLFKLVYTHSNLSM